MSNIRQTSSEPQMAAWLESVPRLFAEGQGRLLYSGRNEVRLFEVGGRQLVAKRFRRHGALKRLVYTYLRQNKARRAYDNATTLRARGIDTPCEVAALRK